MDRWLLLPLGFIALLSASQGANAHPPVLENTACTLPQDDAEFLCNQALGTYQGLPFWSSPTWENTYNPAEAYAFGLSDYASDELVP